MRVDAVDTVARALDEMAEPGFALEQRLLDVPALGDVARRDRDAILDAHGLMADPPLLAALVLDLHIVVERLAGLDDLDELREKSAVAERREHLAHEAPDEVEPRAAEQRFAALVELDDAEVDDGSALVANALAEEKCVETRRDRAAKPVLENAQRCRVVAVGGQAHRIESRNKDDAGATTGADGATATQPCRNLRASELPLGGRQRTLTYPVKGRGCLRSHQTRREEERSGDWVRSVGNRGLAAVGSADARARRARGPYARLDASRSVGDARRNRRSSRSAERICPSATDSSGPCDVHIGRYCYWRGDDDEEHQPEEPPEIVERDATSSSACWMASRPSLPGDPWVAGQRIRYLVEAGRTDEALQFAGTGCHVSADWCAALAGYAAHVAGRFADRRLRVSRGAWPP